MRNLIKINLAPNFFAIFIFFIALAIFALNSLHLNFGFGVEESRYILFAQEMLRSGITPFPLLYGQPYPDYPATHTILIYLFSFLTQHQITPLAAILPSALASAIMLAFTYRLGALYSVRWGLYASLFLLATYEFLLLACLPSPDPLVGAVTIVSFYLAYTQKNSKKLTVIFLSLFALGFLIRGPMGLVIPALTAASFYLLEKNFREFFTLGASSVLLLVICLLSQLFIAQQAAGVVFAKQVFFMEIGGRIAHLGQRAFYYYFVNSLGGYAIAFPFALLTIFMFGKHFFARNASGEIHLLKHLTSWALIILLLLSIPQEKHFRYIISVAPAFALIAAYSFSAQSNSALLLKIRNGVFLTCKWLPVLGLLLTAAAIFAHLTSYLTLSLFLVLSLFNIFGLTRIVDTASRQLATFSMGVAALLVVFITMAQPLAARYITSIKPLVDQVSFYRQPQQQLFFYQVEPDREGLKFAVLLNNIKANNFVSTPEQLGQLKQPALFVASQKVYDTLTPELKKQYKILRQEKLARNSWVLFSNQVE